MICFYSKYLASLTLVALVATGCTGKKGDHQKVEPIKVKVSKVQSYSSNDLQSYVGVVEEESAAALSFSVQGMVERIYVSEGQSVTKGQLLATLGKENLQSSYDAAVATLKQAQDAVNRLQQLYNNKSLPEIKYVEAQTKLEQARSMAEISKKNLSNVQLKAPFDGVIGKKYIEIGENAIPGNAAFNLLKIGSVKVKVAIPEDEISNITLGRVATVDIPAANALGRSGKIVDKGISAHPISHSYDIKIALTNSNRELMPGMVCRVWLDKKESSTAIVLPNTAVQLSPDGKKYVWCIENGKAKAVTITTGALSEKGVTITAGLVPGAEVITDGYQKISEGMEVTAL